MSDILKQYDDFESIECYYESSMKINEPLVQWISEAADEIARLRAERDEWQNNAVEWELDFYTAYHEITRLRAELAEAQAQLAVAREGLEQITGKHKGELRNSAKIARDTLAKLEKP